MDLPLLSAAVAEGDDVFVRSLLRGSDIDVNAREQSGATALFRAIRHHESSDILVRALLSCRRVRVDVHDNRGWTPLHTAIGYCDSDAVVQSLLRHAKTDVNAGDSANWTAVHYAAEDEDKVSFLWLLLQKEGVDVNARNSNGDTPLHVAMGHGNEAVVRLLLGKEGVDVNARNGEEGSAPLHMAIEHGYDSIVEWILARSDVDVTQGDDLGDTPLHIAARRGALRIVELLLEKEAIDVNRQNRAGETPLHAISEEMRGYGSAGDSEDEDSEDGESSGRKKNEGHEVIVALLVAGADASISDAENAAALDIPVADRDEGFHAGDLLFGFTKLHLAACSGDIDGVERLLNKEGEDAVVVDAETSQFSRTPLYFACRCGHAAIVEKLVLSGSAYIKRCDEYTSALGVAAMFDRTSVIDKLTEMMPILTADQLKGGRLDMSQMGLRFG